MAFGTAMKRVDPLQEWVGLQDRVNQLFRSNFSGYGDDTLNSGAWTPNVDIYETPEAIEMTFEIPGVEQKDIKVHLENNLLTVSGERKLEHEPGAKAIIASSATTANFCAALLFPRPLTRIASMPSLRMACCG